MCHVFNIHLYLNNTFSSLRYLLPCISISGWIMYRFIFYLTVEHVRHCLWKHVTLELQQQKKENNLNIINISHFTYKILKQPAHRGTLEHSGGIESFHFSVDQMTRDRKKKSQFKTGNIRIRNNQIFRNEWLLPMKAVADRRIIYVLMWGRAFETKSL